MRITELVRGDQVVGWMPIGKALRRGRLSDGTIFRFVPVKPVPISSDDLQRFIGQVVFNNLELITLTLNVSRMGRYIDLVDTECLQAEVPYTSLLKLRRINQLNNPPKPKDGPSSLVRYLPYRTIEDVLLKW